MRYRGLLLALALICLPMGTGFAQTMKAKPDQKPMPKMDKKEADHNMDHNMASHHEDFNAAVARRVTADEIKEWLDDDMSFVVLDTRSSISGPKVKDSVHVRSTEVEEWAKDKDKAMRIVAYCT